jgi:hypothetical protein
MLHELPQYGRYSAWVSTCSRKPEKKGESWSIISHRVDSDTDIIQSQATLLQSVPEVYSPQHIVEVEL